MSDKYQGLHKEEVRNEYGQDIHYTSWPVGKIPKANTLVQLIVVQMDYS